MASWRYNAAMGVIVAATGFNIGGMMNDDISSGEKQGFSLSKGSVEVSVQDFRDGMTMPHYFKISGIAEALEEDGITMPSHLDIRLRYAERLSEAKYAQYEGREQVQIAFDMARSEGLLETRNGEWDVALLEEYVDRVMEMDNKFVKAADATAAYMRDAGMSADDADFYVRQSLGISYVDFLQPERAAVSGRDDRLVFRSSEHVELVSEIHEKMHEFLQRRLESNENIDEAFTYEGVEDSVMDIDAPGVDI